MKFACIEYSTKTGASWKHRSERPNYLCDPLREIDPTSFGCYTSALAGEHIPLTGLIYGSTPSAPTLWQRLPQDLARRFRGTFRPYALGPLTHFDVLLCIYQISNDRELVRFAERVRATFPQTILVSSSSPPFGRLREHWKDHPETARRSRAFLEATHFNMNVCRATVPWYRAFSDVPSLYLPQPYPVEYATSCAKGNEVAAAPGISRVGVEPPTLLRPATSGASDGQGGQGERLSREARRAEWEGGESQRSESRWDSQAAISRDPGAQRPVIYVAGDTVRPDIMTGHLVAKVLQERHPEHLIRITKTPEFALNMAFLSGTRYEVMPFRAWPDQLRELASVRLVINTDLWWTRGRVPVDCAAAGVPCVGTTSDGQTELWPDLATGNSVEVDRLLDLAEQALSDQSFRAQVIAKAKRRLQNYSYAHTVERFTRAVALARSGRLNEWRDPVWGGDDTLVLP